MTKKRTPYKLTDLARRAYDLMSGDGYSFSQLAGKLGFDPETDGSMRDALYSALQALEEKRLISLAVDRNAPPYIEDGPVGPDTFRHYRTDEEAQLTNEGRLSPAYTVEVGLDVVGDILGIETPEQRRRRARGVELQTAITRLFQGKEK